VVSEGSIAVDGISLTVASLHGNKAGISVIPHTFKNTIIRNYRTGGRVNIETDFLAKYIEKLLPVSKKDSEKFSGDWFSKHGY
jgi:riboflavin synthase